MFWHSIGGFGKYQSLKFEYRIYYVILIHFQLLKTTVGQNLCAIVKKNSKFILNNIRHPNSKLRHLPNC